MAIVGKKEYNLLVLGQTGTGKSTFINALCNYMMFEKLDEALQAKGPTYLIPTAFNWESQHITIGLDKDHECQDMGKSGTQCVKSYLFEMDHISIRIIDTPGFGDTAGYEKDEKASENLFRYLSDRKKLHKLHGIVFIFKALENRITTFFKYCIDHVISKIHSSACKNVTFLITHARGSLYKPGSTLSLIKSEFENSGMPMTDANIFCMENDCIHFLLAKLDCPKNSTPTDDNKCEFQKAWNHSSKECIRLFRYIKTLKAHALSDTILVNRINHYCVKLNDICSNIQNNISEGIKECKKYEEVKKQTNATDTDKLYSILYEKASIRKEGRCLECSNSKCPRRGGRNPVCCINCKAWNMTLCGQISPSQKCKVCGCNASEHVHVKNYVPEKTKHDEKVNENIQTKQEKLNLIGLMLYEEKINIKKYQAEGAYIQNRRTELSNYHEMTSISSDKPKSAKKSSTVDHADIGKRIDKIKYELPRFDMVGPYVQELLNTGYFKIPVETVHRVHTVLDSWKEIDKDN